MATPFSGTFFSAPGPKNKASVTAVSKSTVQNDPLTTRDPLKALAEQLFDYLCTVKDITEETEKPHPGLEAGHFDRLIQAIEENQHFLIPAIAKDRDRLSKLIELTMHQDHQLVISELSNALHQLAVDVILSEPAHFNLDSPEKIAELLAIDARTNPELTDTFLEAIARNVLVCQITHTDKQDNGLLWAKSYFGNSDSQINKFELNSDKGSYKLSHQPTEHKIKPYVPKDKLFVSFDRILSKRENAIRRGTKAFFESRNQLIELLQGKSEEEQRDILCKLSIKATSESSYNNGLQKTLSEHLFQYPNRLSALLNEDNVSEEVLGGSNNSLLNSFCIRHVAERKALEILLDDVCPELTEENSSAPIAAAAG